MPIRFRSNEPRPTISISRKTDIPSEAALRAGAAWDGMIASWDARLAGENADADAAMAAARQIAKIAAFRYMPVDRVAKLPLGELLARIEAFQQPGKKIDTVRPSAMLGLVKPPVMKLSRAVAVFLDLTKQRQVSTNRNQLRIWKNQRTRPIAMMIDAIGDTDIAEIGADDLPDLRDTLWAQVETGQIQRGTVNEHMGHAFNILRTVNTITRLRLNLDF